MTKLSDTTRAKLKTVSTATVATALFKRGFRIQMIQDVHPLGPDEPVLVGEAFTLRYMPAREDLNKIEVFRDRGHPQRKAMEDCPDGAVLVMDSRKDARAASAGAILVTRLMKRGLRRRHHRRGLSQLGGNRRARFSRLSPASKCADQSDAASGDRDRRGRSAAATRRYFPAM